MTETKFYMVKGNLKPSIQAALKWKDGSVVDLTGCTGVKFHMKQGSSVLIDKDASIVDPPTSGVVQFYWASGDTDYEGVCNAEFEVTFGDGKSCTWPTEAELKIIFRKPYDS